MAQGLRKREVTALAVRLQGIAEATRVHAGYLPLYLTAEIRGFHTAAEQLELEAQRLLDKMARQRAAAREARTAQHGD